ncbi:ABC transporter substrate-binding protein [Bacillus aquiflavi]|uniref:ABC transporter substrate-binding protein n=1 Tax=Bacillus aquiflavi TaxID=2672567 RepID=A0A6B3W1N0_9BACI|nr:ABC transporter substrate-binding protein [Bacillus aquiflavi]MBA4538266.1 ABC transporter substrate-binding protein [Bacillus aquiflavi]NEY82585.1 ABC transporter substrate-binding protein [Bacillus aquiflavi]UAC48157.1 ABC transporter substrate-binding protein [Bacillus aquiflavi]
MRKLTFKQNILQGLLLVASLFVLSACQSDENGRKKANGEGQYEMTVGISQTSGAPLVDIAVQEGYFEDENLTVKRIGFANSADGLNALQAGKIDIGMSFGTAGPLTFIANDSDLSIIGGHLEGGHPILVKKGNKDQYKLLEDYKGKKIGTIRIFTSDIVFRSALAEAGIDWENDLEIVEFKTGNMLLEAVASGKVDVAVSANTFYAQAQEMGLEAVTWSNDLQPSHVCCRVVTRTELLDENDGEAYKRFLKAIIRAERKKLESPKDAVTAAREYMNVDDEVIDTIVNEEHSHYSADPSKNKVVEMWKQMQDIGYVEDVENIDINHYINIDLYERALRELIEENPDDRYYEEQFVKFKEQNT